MQVNTNNHEEIIDITPLVSEQIAVWPGDTPFERQELLSFEKKDNLVLSSIKTTVHLGAHADAPIHYHPDGGGIASRALNYYLGDCQVIEIPLSFGKRIFPADIQCEIRAPRVLFKTSSFPDPNSWNENFMALSAELVEFLHTKNVITIGIDTPSIDLMHDKDLVTHNKVYEKNMAILEGIVLTKVVAGIYQLIALPLKIANADASPVRAVLIKNK